MVSRSWYCPCISPQICTGASSSTSMGCSWSTHLAMEQSPSTSVSLSTLKRSCLAGVSLSRMMMSSILRVLVFFILVRMHLKEILRK